MQVFNIKELKVGTVAFDESHDHAKWCVTTHTAIPVVCIGDINRQVTLSPVLLRESQFSSKVYNMRETAAVTSEGRGHEELFMNTFQRIQRGG